MRRRRLFVAAAVLVPALAVLALSPSKGESRSMPKTGWIGLLSPFEGESRRRRQGVRNTILQGKDPYIHG